MGIITTTLKHMLAAKMPDEAILAAVEEMEVTLSTTRKKAPQSLDKSIYSDVFEEFWKGYPSDANMSKREAFAAWRLLTCPDQSDALSSLPAFQKYCRARPDYRPVHACRYLSQHRFDGHVQAGGGMVAILCCVNEHSDAGREWEAHYRQTRGRGVPWTNGKWRFPTETPQKLESSE